jgi:alkylation response protein AidB-like acyl-CoA dehydrogenase
MAGYAPPMSPSSPLAAARDLFAEVRALAPRIEADRRLPPELVARLTEAGFFRLVLPRALGGLEADMRTVLEAIEEVSRADGSTGWIVMIGATTGVAAAYLDPAVAGRIFTPDTLAGGVAAPLGQAQVTDGGYRLSGRWPFSSGIHHTGWLAGGAVLFENGAPRLRNGAPETRLLLFPTASVQVHDTWHVAGLRGSGSHDMEAKDLAVPGEHSLSLLYDRPRHPGPLYAFPVFSLLGLGVAAVALGIARGAVDELVRIAREKVPMFARATLATKAGTQAKVAEAEALVRSARAFLHDAMGRCWALVEEGREVPLALRAELRLAGAHAASSAARAVDIAYHAVGTTSMFDGSPLQRALRDVHVVTQHAMVGLDIQELAGRVLLGVDTDTSRL